MNTHEQIKTYAASIRFLFKSLKNYTGKDISVKVKKCNSRSIINISILNLDIDINFVRHIAWPFDFKNDTVTYIFIDYSSALKEKAKNQLDPIARDILNITKQTGNYTIVENNKINISINNNLLKILFKEKQLTKNEYICKYTFQLVECLFNIIYIYRLATLDEIKNNYMNYFLTIKNFY